MWPILENRSWTVEWRVRLGIQWGNTQFGRRYRFQQYSLIYYRTLRWSNSKIASGNVSKKLCYKTACVSSLEGCSAQPDRGPCTVDMERWYYDNLTVSCRPFYYGGCLGNPKYVSPLVTYTAKLFPFVFLPIVQCDLWYCCNFRLNGIQPFCSRFSSRKECEGVCIQATDRVAAPSTGLEGTPQIRSF